MKKLDNLKDRCNFILENLSALTARRQRDKASQVAHSVQNWIAQIAEDEATRSGLQEKLRPLQDLYTPLYAKLSGLKMLLSDSVSLKLWHRAFLVVCGIFPMGSLFSFFKDVFGWNWYICALVAAGIIILLFNVAGDQITDANARWILETELADEAYQRNVSSSSHRPFTFTTVKGKRIKRLPTEREQAAWLAYILSIVVFCGADVALTVGAAFAAVQFTFGAKFDPWVFLFAFLSLALNSVAVTFIYNRVKAARGLLKEQHSQFQNSSQQDLRMNLTQLATQVEQLRVQMAPLTSEIEALGTRIERLTRKIEKKIEEISRLQSQIHSAKASVQGQRQAGTSRRQAKGDVSPFWDRDKK